LIPVHNRRVHTGRRHRRNQFIADADRMNVGTACSVTFLVVIVAVFTRNCCEAYMILVHPETRPSITLRRIKRQSSQVGSVVVTASEYETRTSESPSQPTTMLVDKERQKVTASRTAGAAATQDHQRHHDQPHRRLVATTSAGVDVTRVDQLLHELYPPSKLAGRNALSRTDGYWRYVQQGLAPPASLTYGEFDLYALVQLLEEAIGILRSEPRTHKSSSCWHDCVFTDLGSGTGRLVLAAAALYPWKLCRGIELLPGLHQTAVAMAQERDATILRNTAAAATSAPHRRHPPDAAAVRPHHNHQHGTAVAAAAVVGTSSPVYLTGSAVELLCGSFAEPRTAVYFGDSDCIFSFSTCMNGPTMDLMGQAIRRQCRPGTIVITTDYRLPETSAGSGSSDDDDDDEPWWLDNDSSTTRKRRRSRKRIRLLKEIPTYCQLVGGECTAFLHQVVVE
jgi:Histone methylation protein DOT1